MGELYYLVGLPASGKTTYAKKLEKLLGAIRLSSDDLRMELFGDVNCQDRNAELFEEMNKRAKLALKSGKIVVYDATNINSKKRINFINQLPKNISKTCVYFAEDRNSIDIFDMNRDKTVGYEVIERMYRTLQIPMYHEGWNDIKIICKDYKKHNENIIHDLDTYDKYKFALYGLNLDKVVDFPQDTPYHTLSVSRHMYYTYDYIKKLNLKDDKFITIAALLHDIGKPRCKVFKNRYASYYGHENVSAQDSIRILKMLGFDDKQIIHIATLIQLHMRLHSKEFGSKDRFRNMIGSNLYDELLILNNADSQAK